MRIEDRHRQIVEQVRGAGRVLVTELAEHFDVTPETIRRDLTALDRNGALRKVHGGAIPAPALPETGVTQREQVQTPPPSRPSPAPPWRGSHRSPAPPSSSTPEPPPARSPASCRATPT
nr:DeoR family transcriptional regulator [Actinomyces oris]